MAIIQHSHISLPRSVELNWHALHQGWLADYRFSSISFLCVSFRLWYLAVSFMGLLGLFPLLPASGNFCLLWSFSIWPQQVSSFSFPSLLTVLAWLVWSGPWSCCSSASIWNLSYIFTKKPPCTASCLLVSWSTARLCPSHSSGCILSLSSMLPLRLSPWTSWDICNWRKSSMG